jgi:hypothetical protein
MLLLAPALTYLADKYTEAELQHWQREGTIDVAHYAFEQDAPLRYDYHLDGLRYLQPVPPPAPTMIIHGRNDEVIPIENSRRYVATYLEQTQLVEVDSDHRLNDQLDLIWQQVRSFLLDQEADMTQRLKKIEDAETILDDFNGFHDGFIKQLILKSSDEFKGWGHQLCTGNLSLEIIFAHYNFAAGERPHTQLVAAEFRQVKDLSINFSGQAHEWSILNVLVTESTRTRADGSSEPCFKAVFLQNRLESNEWKPNEDLAFTSAESVFREI